MKTFRQNPLSNLLLSATKRYNNQNSRKMAAVAAASPNLVLENMNPCIKKMEYAVRGPLVIRATAIEKV